MLAVQAGGLIGYELYLINGKCSLELGSGMVKAGHWHLANRNMVDFQFFFPWCSHSSYFSKVGHYFGSSRQKENMVKSAQGYMTGAIDRQQQTWAVLAWEPALCGTCFWELLVL